MPAWRDRWPALPACCICSETLLADRDGTATVEASPSQDAAIFPATVLQTRASALASQRSLEEARNQKEDGWNPAKDDISLSRGHQSEELASAALSVPRRPPPLPPPRSPPPEEEHSETQVQHIPPPEETPEPLAAFVAGLASAGQAARGPSLAPLRAAGEELPVPNSSTRAAAAEGLLASAGHRLEVLLNSMWTPMHPDDTATMIARLQEGHCTFKASLRGGMYFVSFTSASTATQTNIKSGKTRRMRVTDPKQMESDAAPPLRSAAKTQKKAKAGKSAKRSDEGAQIRSESSDSAVSPMHMASSENSDGEKCRGSSSTRVEEWLESSSSCLTFAQQQEAFGPQSKRGGAIQLQLKVLEDNSHALACFQKMQHSEEQLCAEWAVFYHSYSHAALLYEVNAAVAAVLFGFNSADAPLPRILIHEFNDVPDVSVLMQRYTARYATKLKDHDPEFRAVAISAMCSLVSLGPEASPPVVFMAGYSQQDLSFRSVLENLLLSCFVPKAKVQVIADKVIALAEQHGLDASQFGGQGCASGKAGHLLQIFVRRELVDTLAYAAVPWGAVDPERHPISRWLDSDDSKLWGQARLLANPEYFLESSAVQMFVASADPMFHAHRRRFQKDLTHTLHDVLGDATVRRNAATGLYGSALPSWWRDPWS